MRDLCQVLVILAQILIVLPDLIEALGLEQHTRIRAGQTDNGECTHQRRGDKSIHVVQRKRNLPYATIFISGNKKYVIAFSQHVLLSLQHRARCY